MTDNINNLSRVIKKVEFSRELETSYLDYSLSVIISRALPDARDGLKPVQRRILYAMKNAGYDYTDRYQKCAGTVGDTLKYYHPHGDTSVYDAMVRLAQSFTMRYTLIDGQGNFGSMDGDPAAAYRYTEARLDRFTQFMMHPQDMCAVDHVPNYSNTTTEPSVLPVRFPHMLVNGASGIAVGMATNIPPHNINEVLEAIKALLDNPDLSTSELLEYIPGPDFPLGGEICGKEGIYQAYDTGRGAITLRGLYNVEKIDGRDTLLITCLPYQVNKADFVTSIAELVKSGEIDEISDLRDESSEDAGVRVVVELKRNACEQTLINKLLSKTQLQMAYHINMLAILNNQPIQVSLKRLLEIFIDFREKIVIKRTLHLLAEAKEHMHKLFGLALAVSDIDRIIPCVRSADDQADAEAKVCELPWHLTPEHPLMKMLSYIPEDVDFSKPTYHLTPVQAKAIVELRLYRLTRLENGKISNELNELSEKVKKWYQILNDRPTRIVLMKEEFDEVMKHAGDKRRSIISDKRANLSLQDTIEDAAMIVTLSVFGYIKRVPIENYRLQKRGGKGKSVAHLHADDMAIMVLNVTNHTRLLFFSSIGKVYALPVYALPETSVSAMGKALVNLLPLDHKIDEKIASISSCANDDADTSILFVTANGTVRKNDLKIFEKIPTNGKRVMAEDEKIVTSCLVSNHHDIILTTNNGKAIRFSCSELRSMQSRESAGVTGIKLDNLNHKIHGSNAIARVVSGIKVDNTNDNMFVLTISIKGFGKRTLVSDYRCAHRAGKGVLTMDITKKTGAVLTALMVTESDEIMMLSKNGQVVRCPVADIRMSSRNTQGVKLIDLTGDDELTYVSLVTDRE